MTTFQRIFSKLAETEQSGVNRRIAALNDAALRPAGFTLIHHSSGTHWPNKDCQKCRLEALEVALGDLGRHDLMKEIK